MPVTIITKVSLPTSTEPLALKKLGLCRAFGTILPLSGGGDAANEAQLAVLGKAIKREQKLLKASALKFTQGVAAFRKAAKTYLSSKLCLLVALFEDNARQRLEDRRSVEELIALSLKYEILKKLNEPAQVWQVPKASGKGMRVICSFGRVARAAQLMTCKLLGLTYQPQPFQFDKQTFSKKVQVAMKFIEEEGHTHVTEIDIKDFFPSFTEEALLTALPLPKEAIRQIVLAKCASWGPHPLYGHYGHISFPPGIPQGSASSAAVADWCVANMPLVKPAGSVVINHADNFFAFSGSSEAVQDVAKALSSGIAGLPGGNFHGKTVQAFEVKHGFRMLGCDVTPSKSGTLEAFPNDTNLTKFRKSAGKQNQRVYRRLTEAHMEQSKKLRIVGLQDYLRFESMVQGWVQAFAFCGPDIVCVADRYDHSLALLRYTFEITEGELISLKDRSTEIPVKWYSGS